MIVPIYVIAILSVLVQILTAFFNHNRSFGIISSSRLILTVSNALLAIAISFVIFSKGLLIAFIISLLFQFGYLFFHFKQVFTFEVIKKNIILELVKTHKNYPLFVLPHTFLDVLKNNLMIIITAHYFGDTVLGLYSMAERVIKVPTSFVSSSISEVFLKEGSDAYKKDKSALRNYVIKLIKINAALIIMPTLIIIFGGTQIFSIILGEQWALAGWYSSIMGLFLFANFLLSPISNIPIIINKQKEYFIAATSLFTIAYVVYYLLSAMNYSFDNSFMAKSMIEAIGFFLNIAWIIKLIKK